MEMIGDDKRIRALYSEMRFADGQTAPSFAAVWRRAESRAPKTRRAALKLSFAAVTALLVFSVISAAVWSRLSSSAPSANEVRADATARSIITSSPPNQKTPTGTFTIKQTPPRSAMRTAIRRQSLLLARNRKAAEDAKQLASWTSPTAALLASSSDDLFKSLPQLNENATDLKTFLPSRSDKEN
jgi:hypothetical protein